VYFVILRLSVQRIFRQKKFKNAFEIQFA